MEGGELGRRSGERKVRGELEKWGKRGEVKGVNDGKREWRGKSGWGWRKEGGEKLEKGDKGEEEVAGE